MMQHFPFHPEQASTIARSVDYLYLFITAVSLFFTALIFLIVCYFMFKYQRRSPDERPKSIEGSLPLKALWTAIPTLIVAVIFVWGSTLYFHNAESPKGAMEIFVTGRQWMWKVEHPEGQREINELHVPLGRPVKLTMTSEDVIHGFYVPAFRVKKDVLPGRYTSLWFEPTKVGTFHFFCAQYCGAIHAGMIGSVIVVGQDEYARWLAGIVPGIHGEAERPVQAGEPGKRQEQGGAGGQGEMAEAGEKLFGQSGCPTCHLDNGKGPGPSLAGVYGNPVHLTNGQTVTADDAYVRESILDPNAKIVTGYVPMMPSFKGQLSEEQILDLIAYIRSRRSNREEKPGAPVQGGEPGKRQEQGGVGGQGETAEAGEKLFQQSGCPTCHLDNGKGPGPSLAGVYGNPVHLTNGQTVTADDAYIRESILDPNAKIVTGYVPMMPSFKGQLSEEQILDLIAYIRSRRSNREEEPGAPMRRGEPAKRPEQEGVGGQGETAKAAGAQGGSAEAGEKVFQQSGCSACHVAAGKGLGPSLLGVYGNPVRLTNGQTATADDAYIRESILDPNAKIVTGYVPMMPSFKGQLSEKEILDLIAYIRSMSGEPGKRPEREGVGGQGETAKAAGAQGGAAEAGEKLFQQSGCSTCHPAAGRGLGPSLADVYGHPVQLTNSQTVTADDAYIRESILDPNAKIVAGYVPMMPSFKGQLGEKEILDLIAYIRSLSAVPGKRQEREEEKK